MSMYRCLNLTAIMFAVFFSCQVRAGTPGDCLEPINRRVFGFNKVMDALYIKPATVAYENVVPYSTRVSVTNFMKNVSTVPMIAYSILQGNIPRAFTNFKRISINSTLGILGLFDVATQMGIEDKPDDLGKTFYAWGWQNSEYVVLPILGPSTIRDAVGLAGNVFISLPIYVEPKWRNRYWALGLIDKRSAANEFTDVIGTAGVKSYELVRSSYLQHREYQLTDGKVSKVIDENDTLLGEPPA